MVWWQDGFQYSGKYNLCKKFAEIPSKRAMHVTNAHIGVFVLGVVQRPRQKLVPLACLPRQITHIPMRKTRILHLKITPRSVIITCNSQRLKTLPYKQLQAIGSHECANLQRKSPVELQQEPSELHPCSIPKQLSAEADSDQALSSVVKKIPIQRSIAKRKISAWSVQRAACLFIKGTP